MAIVNKKSNENSKFVVTSQKTKIFDIKNLAKQFKKTEDDTKQDYNPFSMKIFQKYNPIYSSFFDIQDGDENNVSLNQMYEFVDMNTVLEINSETEVNKSVFIKFSPLLDPLRYMIGKYDINDEKIRTLPTLSGNVFPKLENKNNASYVDCFFNYLSSQLLNHHGFLNSVDFYGSYLAVQDKYKMNIADDIEYLYVSPFFITNSERATCELENPYILITPNKISSIQDIVGLLEGVLKTSRPLLIVADDVEGEALHTLIVNKTKGVVKVCAIKAPSYGEHRADILSDIQVLTGGTVFNATTDLTLKKASLSHMGSAKKVIIGRSSTTIISDLDVDRKNALEDRIRSLRTSLTEDKTLDALHVDKYRKRLARLSGGVAVIKVGGSTEVEILEKKDRVEDAVNATLAATQEGIVPGGGTALFYAANHLREHIKLKQANASGDYTQDELAGMEIIANVCEYPLNTIVNNTGASPDVIKERLKAATTGHKVFYIDTENADVEDLVSAVRHFKNKSETKKNDRRYGYNAAKGTYGDLVSEGIIDPVKVTRFALQHAVSVIGLTLSCNSVIVNEEEN